MIDTRARPVPSARVRSVELPESVDSRQRPIFAVAAPLAGIGLLIIALVWVMRLEATLPSIRIGQSATTTAGAPVTLIPGTYLAEDPAVVLTGNWFKQTLGTSTPPVTSSSEVTTTAGSSLSFRFYGTDLSMTARIGPESGKVYVTVDGQTSSTLPVDSHGSFVDFYANQAQDQSIPIVHGLAHRDHTVLITSAGTTEVAINGFHVSANSPFPWAFVFLYVALSTTLFVLVRITSVNTCRRFGWV